MKSNLIEILRSWLNEADIDISQADLARYEQVKIALRIGWKYVHHLTPRSLRILLINTVAALSIWMLSTCLLTMLWPLVRPQQRKAYWV